MTTVFESKRDAWLVVMLWAGALVTAYAAFAQLESEASLIVRAAMLVGLVAAAGFMLWVLYGTNYTLAGDTLLIRCGPFRSRVPLAAIDSVKPSRNPLTSPACSLDRLLIKWNDGRKRILISPSLKADFLRELERRCPHLKSEEDGLIRVSPD